jgi:hypothetical protein
LSTSDERTPLTSPTDAQDRTTTPGTPNDTPAKTTPETPSRPYNFILALVVVILASVIFVIVMVIFRDAFKDAALVTTALSTLFGIFGTVLGAYFGIKSSNDSFDKARKDVTEANNAAKGALAALPPAEGKKVMGMTP